VWCVLSLTFAAAIYRYVITACTVFNCSKFCMCCIFSCRLDFVRLYSRFLIISEFIYVCLRKIEFNMVFIFIPCICTRWFKYDRDWFVCKQAAQVPVIFEPPCIYVSFLYCHLIFYVFFTFLRNFNLIFCLFFFCFLALAPPSTYFLSLAPHPPTFLP
jgi:hypothetical protein